MQPSDSPNFNRYGKIFQITPILYAQARRLKSDRLTNQAHHVLYLAVSHALDSLRYVIGVARELKNRLERTPNDPPPKYEQDTFVGYFHGYFLATVNENDLTMREFIDHLTVFSRTCEFVLDGLCQPLTIVDINPKEVNNEDDEVLGGYVSRSIDGTIRGNIHLNFGLLQPGNEWDVAKTLVHEASHKFAHTADHARAFQSEQMGNLSPVQSLENADSIAGIVINSFTLKLA